MDNNQIIKEIDINSEMKNSYIEYAMSVIVSRALPDIRDGLKPVQRRILYAMGELGLSKEQKYRKSAKIVGEVIANYHPHGDSSIYGALVRMAQKFSLRYPLVDGQGNFGTLNGDGAAAMRYTEARMEKLTALMLKDIKKDTVDFVPNFDNMDKEPTVLPSRIPNLLLNGSTGIAVGMATSIPPNNLSEIIDAIVYMIDNPDCEIDDLFKYIKAPDFPTGGLILGTSDYRKAYKTGRGKVTIRAKASIEEMNNGKSKIVITEIPYQVNIPNLLKSIANLVKMKKIDGITDIKDLSNREGIQIEVELRKDVNPKVILNQLYKNTQMQVNFSINMIALVNSEPRLLTIKDCIYYYIEHQKDVETRRIKFDLTKAEERAHILEGYKIAIENIDEVIKIIRNSYNDAEVRLMQTYNLTEIQAKSVVHMQLIRLQGLEIEKIEEEYRDLIVKINDLKKLLSDDKLLLNLIKEDLLFIKNKNNDLRKSEIEYNSEEIEDESLIEEKAITITLTHAGYVKRINSDTYETQNRGGRGKTGLSTREEDYVIDIFNASTHDNLFIFTNFGKLYVIKGYDIPEGSRISKGTAIINLIPIEKDEKVQTILPVSNLENTSLVILTKFGIIKKTLIENFIKVRKNGLKAINLVENDEVIGVRLVNENDDLIAVTLKGQAIRFNESKIRNMGRTAMGVRGVRLREDDKIVALCKIEESDSLNKSLLIVSEKGYAKRSKLTEYKEQNRGGIGNKTYKITEKTGDVIGASVVEKNEEIILINTQGNVIRIAVDEISEIGRVSSGVRVMKLSEDDSLVSFAKIKIIEEDEIFEEK